MTDTAIITRFCYPPSREFDWRFAYWQSFVLPKIRRLEGEFDHYVWTTPWHAPLFQHEGLKTFYLNAESLSTAKDRARAYVPYSKTMSLPKYRYQIALDSDDFPLRRDSLEVLKRRLFGDRRRHVSCAFQLFDVHCAELQPSHYNYLIKGTAFFGLHEPDPEEAYVWAYERPHLHIGKLMQESEFIGDDRYWAASVHDYNVTTKLEGQ